jgi:hypothetical protein
MNSFIVEKDLPPLILTQGKKTRIGEAAGPVLDHRSKEKGGNLGRFDPGEEGYPAHRDATKETLELFACWEQVR